MHSIPFARLLPVALALGLSACCDKDGAPAGSQPLTDRQSVRLKEIVIRNTPSPYYAFEYNDSGYITRVSFEDDMVVYNYFYKNRRIDSVTTSMTDAAYLLYRYQDQKVIRVEQYDQTRLRQVTHIHYDSRNRVSRMEWRPTTSPPEEKNTTFEYYDNGNLSRMISTYPANGLSTTVTYDAYDNKRNVDGFGVAKDFSEHLILLPAVRVQINNPTRMKIVSGPNERTITYDYTYRDSLPLQRNGTGQVTAGPNAGQSYTTQTTFTYY